MQIFLNNNVNILIILVFFLVVIITVSIVFVYLLNRNNINIDSKFNLLVTKINKLKEEIILNTENIKKLIETLKVKELNNEIKIHSEIVKSQPYFDFERIYASNDIFIIKLKNKGEIAIFDECILDSNYINLNISSVRLKNGDKIEKGKVIEFTVQNDQIKGILSQLTMNYKIIFFDKNKQAKYFQVIKVKNGRIKVGELIEIKKEE